VNHESIVARYREEMTSRDPTERKQRAAELTHMREEDRCAKAIKVQDERRRPISLPKRMRNKGWSYYPRQKR